MAFCSECVRAYRHDKRRPHLRTRRTVRHAVQAAIAARARPTIERAWFHASQPADSRRGVTNEWIRRTTAAEDIFCCPIGADSSQSARSICGARRALDRRVQHLSVVADRGVGFASASGDNTVGMFDLNSGRLLQKIPGGVDPDAIIYDEKLHLV